MLLKLETLKGIKNGTISLAFRRWKRPTVKAGGSLLTPIGQLAIEAVEVISIEEITQSDAKAAGFPTLESLLSEMAKHPEGEWTCRVSSEIRKRSGESAADLAAVLGMERDILKAKVWKLKGLDLTESLAVGYRLSPRGEAVLSRIEDSRHGPE
ncbi:MAG: hypothetical protein HKO65_04390 [Gemmatimonadetes bacterium]|nr:hypothetical protein [Gemmatimonadota bacterium]NNM04319.1 hypothetical protein [Gemmatimonadota bacterium]